ncbi:MAG: sulfatase-like hydrolase/transferase, partial [Acidimicrobiia bacterium]
VSAMLITFYHWEALPLAAGTAGMLVSAAVVFPLWAGAYLLGPLRQFRAAALGVAMTLAIVPMVLLIQAESARGSIQVEEAAQPSLPAASGASPDIYLVVLDGYARGDVLQNLYGFDNGPFLSELGSRGFRVAEEAAANYSVTHLSLGGVLSMDYVMGHGTTPSLSDNRRLLEMLQGDNPVVGSLQEAGYVYVHGESGWHGTDCGPRADVCLGGPLVDDTAWSILQSTPLAEAFLRRTRNAITEASLRRWEEISRWPELTVGWPRPRFVFLHLILPHPPFVLNSDCRLETEDSLQEAGREDPASGPAYLLEWRLGYVQQVRCANRMVLTLVDHLPPDAVVVVMGDHGPDSHLQLKLSPEDWEGIHIYERFPVLAALRLPERCDEVPDDLATVNTFRTVFACLFQADLPLLPSHHYISPPTFSSIPLFEVPAERLAAPPSNGAG